MTATRIAVCALEAVPAALAQWRPDAVVSAISPPARIKALSNTRHLVLTFHDVEAQIVFPATRRRVLAGRPHVEQFLEFLRSPPARLLIHCTAGLGRAPALALGAGCAAGHDVETLCAAMRRAVPHASPNRRIIALADDLLALRGQLVRNVAAGFDQNHGLNGAIGRKIGFSEIVLLAAERPQGHDREIITEDGGPYV